MIDVLIANPLLLLFLVAAIGYPLGRLKIRGASLGVAAVLFVGLAFGALDPDLKLPEIIYTLGLALFVYTIGLSSGSVFFASLRRKGWIDNLLAIGGLLFAAGLTLAVHFIFQTKPALTAGLYTGAMTNTPAMASILEYISATTSPALVEGLRSEPVVAYSLTYPVGVICGILTVAILKRICKDDRQTGAEYLHELGASSDPLEHRTVRVTREDVTGFRIADLVHRRPWNVMFGRLRHDGQLTLASGESRLALDDLVGLIGSRHDLDDASTAIGEISTEHLEQDLTKYDKRRIFVSSSSIIGRRLRDLHLFERYGAMVSRIRRGDVELLPRGDTILNPGDQIRVVAPNEQMDALSHLFGDSYRAVSEIDVLTFSIGLAIGILVGMVPIPLSSGVTLKLGMAGGPLIVALVLGAVGRTGPFVWALPYSANLILRQIGLVLFLAGVGTRSGYAFISTLVTGGGWIIILSAVVITALTFIAVFWVGHRLLRIPIGLLTGILAGMQTQTALLGFVLEQSDDELPNIGFATIYPTASIVKIIIAQAIFILLK